MSYTNKPHVKTVTKNVGCFLTISVKEASPKAIW